MKKILLGCSLIFMLSPLYAVKGADLDTIVRRGKIIIGVKNNLPPLAFPDGKGNLQGFEIDIARRIAAEILGSPEAIVLKPVSNRERLQVVIEDKVDLTIARVTVTAARSRVVDFSSFYYLDSTGIVTRDARIKGAGDLKTARIAVLQGSSTIATVRSNLPDARMIPVKSYGEGLELLEKGTVDAFAADNSLIAGWVRQYPAYRQLPVFWDARALAIVMPRGLQYQGLRDRVNGAIERWQKDGWLSERAAYWGLKE